MKRLFAFLLVVALVFSLGVPALAEEFVHWYQPETVLLMDAHTGQILYSKNPDGKIYPASTTKLLTALLVMENVEDLDAVVTVNEESLSLVSVKYDSTLEPILEVGEQMTVRNLLYGMLLPSGSDCACTLGVYVGGTLENFAAMMNRRAQELGMTGSHFVTPHGFPNDDHYITALDMSKVARELLKIDAFMEIVGTSDYVIPATNMNGERVLQNTNHLIEYYASTADVVYEYATGMKTGTSNSAGGCLVASAKKDGVELLCLVYQDASSYLEHRWYLARDLFEWAFSLCQTFDGRVLQDVLIPLTDVQQYGTATVTPDLSLVTIRAYDDLTTAAITAKLILDEQKPSTLMTGTVEYRDAKGWLLASVPATVSIPDYTEPTEATEPSDTEPQDSEKPDSSKPSWLLIILAIVLFVGGVGMGLVWLSGYRTMRAKMQRMERKIARLREKDPEDPALQRLENAKKPVIHYNGLYISLGLLVLALVLLIAGCAG